MDKIQIFKLDDNDVYIIKKARNSRFFVTTSDSIIIPTFNLFAILKFMLYRGLMHPKVLEGLLSEYKEEV